ncbi:T-lymphocyte surface antigen Ly-9-like isoform X1 [Arapaima gigas]
MNQETFIFFTLLILPRGVTNTEIASPVGSTVTLPSGVNKSWTLSTIEWSTNDFETNIIMFHGSSAVKEFNSPLKGRLKLNITSGDLEIKDLRLEHSHKYTVLLENTDGETVVNTVILSVYDVLLTPTIAVLDCTARNGVCLMSLQCSVSSSKNISFEWKSLPFPNGCLLGEVRTVAINNRSIPGHSTSRITAWCSSSQNVEINCTIIDETDIISSTMVVRCPDDPNSGPNIWMLALLFLSGWTVGLIMAGCRYKEIFSRMSH